jgi:hypothetical protein
MRSAFILAASLIFFSARASALTVTLTAKAEEGDKPAIIGTTNLPDGIRLMVSLLRKESQYSAQDKATVRGGAFRAGPFSQKGVGLNPGTYTLTVSMPIANVQPPPTWSVIGKDGANLKGPLVKESQFGGKIVEYKAVFKIGGAQPSAEMDKSARKQSDKDRHTWWLQSCKDICKMTQNLSRQRNEPFDLDRCYYECVADEPQKK